VKSDRSIFEIKQRVDYGVMYRALEFFAERYDFISIGSIGHSVFDRNIPLIKLGKGEKRVIYIGSHHGSESITSGEWKQGWHDFCESKKESYLKAIANAALEASSERDNAKFGHYLDCEAHTDVWRELFPTYNLTNEK
jgi:hypothetical protein